MKHLNIEIGFPKERPEVEYDPDGWLCNDTSKNLLRAINKTKPKVIVEIGSWLGKSSRFLCQNSEATVYCLDTWKGSAEHKHQKHSHKLIKLWETFCVNNWTYKDQIVPIKGDRLDGLEYLQFEGIEPDMFYVDGSHEFDDVKADIMTIEKYWPGKVIVGDDYLWSGVHSAVHGCSRLLGRRFEVEGRKSWIMIEGD